MSIGAGNESVGKEEGIFEHGRMNGLILKK